MKKKGVFITFEGGDGAGKTTLIDKLFEDLKKRKIPLLKTRAPGGTEIGKQIRSLLLEKHKEPLSKRAELLLFLADRAQHVDEQIIPALKAGKMVLCDRYNDSTIAYQGGARGFERTLIEELCDFACGEKQPDLTLYLDLDPKIGFERAKKAGLVQDRIESEALRFHQNIRRAFRQIAKREPKRFILLDASQSLEQVFTQAKKKIDAFLKINRK